MAFYWVAFFGLVLVLGGLSAAFSARRLRGSRLIARALGGILFAIGAGSFTGTGAVSLKGLPATYEWPMGNSARIIRLADGRQLALHDPSGRIQLYAADWQFVRGWSIDAGGGIFHARWVDPQMLEIWTARGNKRYLLNPDGVLTNAGTYPPASYDDFHGEGQKGWVPTPWPLLIFSHPFIAWAVAFAGILMLGLSDPKRLEPWHLRRKEASSPA